jgi:glycosyltransferase involved in cell wall biosynthesis
LSDKLPLVLRRTARQKRRNEDCGGGERLAIELANRQVAAGHRVTMILGHPLPSEQAHNGLSPKVAVVFVSPRTLGRFGKYPEMVRWIASNRALIADQDVCHCHLTYGALFATAARHLTGSGRPAIVETYHAVGMPIPRLQRWFHAQLASQWDGLGTMVDDPYWRSFMEKNSQIASKVIPVGVAAPPLSRVTKRARAEYRAAVGIRPTTQMVVCTIGRLIEERRPRRYVPVFKSIANDLGPAVEFLMGGDGAERGAIERDAAAAGISDSLHLPGLIERVELPLSITDLYVTANVGPVPGVAGLQAIAAGIPVIAIQLSNEYASSEKDWIWSSRDPQAVARQAVQLLQSAELRKELSARQKAHLTANHSAEAMARNYESLYREAMRRRRGSAEPAGTNAVH